MALSGATMIGEPKCALEGTIAEMRFNMGSTHYFKVFGDFRSHETGCKINEARGTYAAAVACGALVPSQPHDRSVLWKEP